MQSHATDSAKPAKAMALRERLRQYALLVRLNKPIGIYLLLWPTLWALWIAAAGIPQLKILLIFIAGTVLMRSAGCAINDYADKDFDPHVERTRERPLANGSIQPREALLVTAVLALLAFCLLFFTNLTTILMSFVALALAMVYPFTKRVTHFPQVVLGAAFSWGIPMAYTALEVPLDVTTWLLFSISLIWALVYDTMYAMVDREDDLKIGVKSTAVFFGKADIAVIASLQVLILSLLILVGYIQQLGIVYYVGLIAAGGFSVYQFRLIRQRRAADCFAAFLNNHYFGMVVFIAIALSYL